MTTLAQPSPTQSGQVDNILSCDITGAGVS
jgi:hypothetical protein